MRLFFKLKGYPSKPQTIPELKAEIESIITIIEPQLCNDIIEKSFRLFQPCSSPCRLRTISISFVLRIPYRC